MSRTWIWTGALPLAALVAAVAGQDGEPATPAEELETTGIVEEVPAQAETPRWTFAVEPKPLSARVEKALDWLVAHQLEGGGWGQGEESAQMGDSLQRFIATPDVADTCMALLALVRSGAVAGAGPRGQAISRGVAYVCGEVEASDDESLYVTSVRGTRVQMKIGTYIDTFLASMLLSELEGGMNEPALDARVENALTKVLAKIERNQRDDGAFEGQGWAPVLSQSMASKGINRALQAGVALDTTVNEENNRYFVAQAAELERADSAGLGASSGPATAGAAGVALYALAANLGGLSDFVNSSWRRERELDAVLADLGQEDAWEDALREKLDIRNAREVQKQSRDALVGRLEDPSFVSGFGSNGGEEFLSYMNVSESLVVEGGDVWGRWDRAVTDNLNRVQNEDGSWSGHHCITGRTFVTSAALLTLMADRAPVPVELVQPETVEIPHVEVTDVQPADGK